MHLKFINLLLLLTYVTSFRNLNFNSYENYKSIVFSSKSKLNFEVEKIKSVNQLSRFISILSIVTTLPLLSFAETPQEKAFNQENIASQKKDVVEKIDVESIKLPYNHENLPLSKFLGKATIVVNMKLDDPQTATQFPSILEIYNKKK